MSNEPTREQIGEFWEWCGFHQKFLDVTQVRYAVNNAKGAE